MNLPFAEGTTLSVEVTDIALPNDYGVARHAGRVLFIPKGLPGDIVRVRVGRIQRRYAFADIVEVEQPSEWRLLPQCPHFNQCGGCSLQHLSYGKQLEVKRAHLREVLRRIGGIDAEDIPVREPVPSPEPFHYRGKIELAAAMNAGRPIFGLKERDIPGAGRPPRIVPVHDCRIFHPRLTEFLAVAERLAHDLNLRPFDPAHRTGTLRYLVLRKSRSTGQIMAVIETGRNAATECRSFARALVREAPWLDSIYSAELSGSGDYRIIDRLTHQHGSQSIVEEIMGLRLKIYPTSFFQPNPGAAELLYGVIAEKAGLSGTENVLGLFCGIGCIELVISRGARFVTGVDSLEANIRTARENATLNNRTNCTFQAVTAEQFLDNLNSRHYDRIIVDPPRSGIPQSALKHLGTSGVPEILYVSCSPPTLARDLGLLSRYRYRVEELIPFDFFPHTSHLETLAVIAKH